MSRLVVTGYCGPESFLGPDGAYRIGAHCKVFVQELPDLGPPRTARLSKLQRWILRWIAWWSREKDRAAETRSDQELLWLYGPAWRPSRWVEHSWSRTMSASVSRALRRLEGRGLIRRTNYLREDEPWRRAWGVALTWRGKEAVRLLKLLAPDGQGDSLEDGLLEAPSETANIPSGER